MLALPPTSIRPGDRVAVAVSGGADSTALLLLVLAANSLPRNALGVGLAAVHVNHSLRGEESDADATFVRELCERLQIPLHTKTVDTAKYAEANKETLEEAARNLRYGCFRELIEGKQANLVMTAHTLDDQAETVLMKLLRGAWLEGLSGIAPMLELPCGRILRPLLQTRRDDLRAFLTQKSQPWREDRSNSDEAFTRNRVRANMLPLLRQENPLIDEALANLAELAREEEARWQTELNKLLPQLILPGKPIRGGGRANSTVPGTQTLALELDRLRQLDPAARRRVVRAAARQLGARLSFDETSRLLALAGLPPSGYAAPSIPSKPGARLQLSHSLLAERSARELRLSVARAA